MTDLQQDLVERWRPNQRQIDGAEALLGVLDDERIWTPHLLLNKEFGCWTAAVTVIAVDGWFLSMEQASEYGRLVAAIHRVGAMKMTVGTTTHSKGKQWAVFEDILSLAD